MTQGPNRVLDDIARLMTDAAGAAQGVRREVQSVVRSQGERMLRDMDMVPREEFEIVKAMVQKARMDNEALLKRIEALEADLKQLKLAKS